MIKTETFYVGEREFTRTYSDSGRYVVRDGISYEEACDPTELGRTYTEGEEIPVDEPTNEDYMTIGKIMMGVNVNDDN